MKSHIRSILLWAALLAFLDQISKYLIIRFGFHYSQNTGIAFSIPLPFWLLTAGGIIFLVLIVFLATKEFNLNKPLSRYCIALIVGGGLGNLIDRFARGAVIDFISIWKWPTFNLADIFVTVGVLMILVFYGRISAKLSTK